MIGILNEKITMKKEIDRQIQRIRHGTEELFVEEDLREKLKESLEEDEPLRVKLGVDPTATDLHLGHSVVLQKLATFQELGHQVILIIGDFTARIGDPSDKDETRPTLTAEEVEENFQDYIDQIDHILDLDELEVRYNSDWLEPLGLEQLIELASDITVARFMEHDRFRKRFESNRSIRLHEFLYPVMQAYDSIAIEADVELGGTDQTFNLLVARDMMKREGLDPQVALTVPLLIGLDGERKMSKSLDNHIGIQEEPYELFSKIMSISDDMMENYFRYLTDVPDQELREYRLAGKNPMDLKKYLGRQVVENVHGDPELGKQAEERWTKVFSDQETPEDLDVVDVRELVEEENGDVTLLKLLRYCDFVDSNNQGRRLIDQGAVRLNDEKQTKPKEHVEIEEGDVLRVGKKRRMVELTLGELEE